jgi:hypothetical protein
MKALSPTGKQTKLSLISILGIKPIHHINQEYRLMPGIILRLQPQKNPMVLSASQTILALALTIDRTFRLLSR